MCIFKIKSRASEEFLNFISSGEWLECFKTIQRWCILKLNLAPIRILIFYNPWRVARVLWNHSNLPTLTNYRLCGTSTLRVFAEAPQIFLQGARGLFCCFFARKMALHRPPLRGPWFVGWVNWWGPPTDQNVKYCSKVQIICVCWNS